MPTEDKPKGNDVVEPSASETSTGPNRRDVGRFLAYTAPALIALITAKNADAYN